MGKIRKKIEKRYKNYFRWGVINTTIGILVLLAGLFIYICGNPRVGIGFLHQTIVRDGSMWILLGMVFLMAGGYRLIHGKKRFIKDRMEELVRKMQEDEEWFSDKGNKHREVAKKRIEKARRELKLYKTLLQELNDKHNLK